MNVIKKSIFFIIIMLIAFLFSEKITINPITHSSVVIEYNKKTIYIDPNGDIDLYNNYKSPDIIIITSNNSHHLNLNTLHKLNTKQTTIVVSNKIKNYLPDSYKNNCVVFNNNEQKEVKGIIIKAKDTGFVIKLNDKKIYVSGELKNTKIINDLKNIDVAFVCLSIKNISNAILKLKPKIVYPYHSNKKNYTRDIENFKTFINKKSSDIDVRIRNWFPKKQLLK